ncbi:MAG: hypothetical protein HC880_01990 [Bacteroidia bacterium]|nr:hypothetical protein [Bacteroidia bacterium]
MEQKIEITKGGNGYLTSTYLKDTEVTNSPQTQEVAKHYNDATKVKYSDYSSDLSELLITQKGIIDQARWIPKLNISGKVIDIMEDVVIVECLIDKEKRHYQKRAFSRSLFININSLDVGVLILIKTYEKPPEVKLKILDGKGIIPESDFTVEDIFDKVKKSPIFRLPPKKK